MVHISVVHCSVQIYCAVATLRIQHTINARISMIELVTLTVRQDCFGESRVAHILA